jgi:hypothetical protein
MNRGESLTSEFHIFVFHRLYFLIWPFERSEAESVGLEAKWNTETGLVGFTQVDGGFLEVLRATEEKAKKKPIFRIWTLKAQINVNVGTWLWAGRLEN